MTWSPFSNSRGVNIVWLPATLVTTYFAHSGNGPGLPLRLPCDRRRQLESNFENRQSTIAWPPLLFYHCGHCHVKNWQETNFRCQLLTKRPTHGCQQSGWHQAVVDSSQVNMFALDLIGDWVQNHQSHRLDWRLYSPKTCDTEILTTKLYLVMVAAA